MNRILLSSAMLFLLLATLTSCEEGAGCQLSTEAPLRAGFYGIIDDTLEIDTVTGSFSVMGIGASDTLISSRNENSIQLSLNPFTDSSAFIFEWELVVDTLTFKYERSMQLLSEECGFITKFEVNEVKSTYNLIDSVALIENTVNTENERHLKIYF